MSGWGDNGTWMGCDLRREVFFFRSGSVDLYGSLYAAAEPALPWGVVACGSWGTEADRTDPLLRSVALAAAKLGGVGLVFHYPGYGDSFGDLADVGLADLRQAAAGALEEASRRYPGFNWVLAGFMFGASVACLAQAAAAVEWLLLVQPSLRPGEYCRRLAATRRPLAPGPSPRQMMEVGGTPGMAYGYPIPARILECAEEADAAVGAALGEFSGGGAVVCHETPAEPAPPAERLERIEVPGTWRFGSQNNDRLAAAAGSWLERRVLGIE